MTNKKSFNKEVGIRLRVIRGMKGLTQAQAGKLMGVTRVQVVNIEQGNSGVKLFNLYRYCRKIGVSIYSVIPDSTRGRR